MNQSMPNLRASGDGRKAGAAEATRKYGATADLARELRVQRRLLLKMQAQIDKAAATATQNKLADVLQQPARHSSHQVDRGQGLDDEARAARRQKIAETISRQRTKEFNERKQQRRNKNNRKIAAATIAATALRERQQARAAASQARQAEAEARQAERQAAAARHEEAAAERRRKRQEKATAAAAATADVGGTVVGGEEGGGGGGGGVLSSIDWSGNATAVALDGLLGPLRTAMAAANVVRPAQPLGFLATQLQQQQQQPSAAAGGAAKVDAFSYIESYEAELIEAMLTCLGEEEQQQRQQKQTTRRLAELLSET